VASLTLVSLGEPQVYAIDQTPFSIGRLPDCDLQLVHDIVSRKHATIERTDAGYVIKALGTTNPTKVNAEPVRERVLRDGDEIAVGPFLLKFDAYATPLVVVAEQAHGVCSNLSGLNTEQTMTGGQAFLLDAVEKLFSISDLNTLLDRLLTNVMTYVHADCLVILLQERPGGDLVPRTAQFAPNVPRMDPVPVSRTVIGHCRKSRAPVIVGDVAAEPDLEKSVGVVRTGAKSLFALPIVKHEQVLGVIYALGLKRSNQFLQRDLAIVQSIVHVAGVALERALLQERADREAAVRKFLASYFSPPVARQLAAEAAAGGKPLAPREEMVTVLFADLEGSTGFIEGLRPAQVPVFLSDYLSLMSEIIHRHDGGVDKFIGDGILGVFGMSRTSPHDGTNAMAAALEMIQSWRSARKDHGAENVPVRIGINTGHAFLGTIQTPQRHEFTVVGDAVNVASRLQSMAQGDSAVVSDSTRRQDSAGRFGFEDLGMREIRGRTAGVQVWRLTGKA